MGGVFVSPSMAEKRLNGYINMHNGSDSAPAASTAVQVYGPTLTTYTECGAAPARTASDAAPPRNIKYEFGMKNEDYHNRCPSCRVAT